MFLCLCTCNYSSGNNVLLLLFVCCFVPWCCKLCCFCCCGGRGEGDGRRLAPPIATCPRTENKISFTSVHLFYEKFIPAFCYGI